MSSKSELERQTDRTVAATDRVNTSVREQTSAVRAQTAAIRDQTDAIHEQTDAINEGFAATVSALHEQTDVLRSVDLSIQTVAHEMRGLREDIYAATQNREALEAKSKLDRAEQLLASDLPADALRLIREAEVLNPADFAVWSMKVMFCHRALEVGIGAMTAEEARTEGSAAIERALKLFPSNLLGSARSLHVLRWLVGTSILLASPAGFERSIALYDQSLDAGGRDLALSPPATGTAHFLRDVRQEQAAQRVARANGRLLTRIAQSGDPAALRAMIPAWLELTATYPDVVGPDVERAILAGASGAVKTFVRAAADAEAAGAAQFSPPHGPFRDQVASWTQALEERTRAPFAEVEAWHATLEPVVPRVASLRAVRSQTGDIVKEWAPAQWKQQASTLAQPPRPVGRLGKIVTFGMAAISIFAFANLPPLGEAPSDSDKAAFRAVSVFLFMMVGGAILPHAYYFVMKTKPLASPSTVEVVERVRGLIQRWQAFK